MMDPAHYRRSSTPELNFLPLWPLKQFISHDLTFNIYSSAFPSADLTFPFLRLSFSLSLVGTTLSAGSILPPFTEL
jgi:hypothetical protein